ncbi:MAG: helical backbone metal receptor [Bacteroidota bacterium]
MANRLLTDQMGRQVEIVNQPQSIISLVPSQTELLVDLGLGDRLVGRTKFCIHPEDHVKQIPSVGGTKKVKLDKIAELQPDLIIGNKEENEQEQIEVLASQYPVWMSDISNLDDALGMIQSVGELVNKKSESEMMSAKITDSFESVKDLIRGRVVYLIWDRPIMTAGSGTFIDDMLCRMGMTNAIQQPRYPELTIEELKSVAPDYLFLSSEPYPYRQTHLEQYQEQLPHTKVALVDGEMFSWYGSRLLQSPNYFRNLALELS